MNKSLMALATLLLPIATAFAVEQPVFPIPADLMYDNQPVQKLFKLDEYKCHFVARGQWHISEWKAHSCLTLEHPEQCEFHYTSYTFTDSKECYSKTYHIAQDKAVKFLTENVQGFKEKYQSYIDTMKKNKADHEAKIEKEKQEKIAQWQSEMQKRLSRNLVVNAKDEIMLSSSDTVNAEAIAYHKAASADDKCTLKDNWMQAKVLSSSADKITVRVTDSSTEHPCAVGTVLMLTSAQVRKYTERVVLPQGLYAKNGICYTSSEALDNCTKYKVAKAIRDLFIDSSRISGLILKQQNRGHPWRA